jgi:hypothetical protein
MASQVADTSLNYFLLLPMRYFILHAIRIMDNHHGADRDAA